MSRLVENIKIDEGFEKKPYTCPAGKLTIGYGTNIEDGISEAEAELLLTFRLNQMISQLLEKKPIILRLPQDKQEIIFNMMYNLGVAGILKFKMFWLAVENFDYKVAAVEMRDSLWYRQVMNRAEKLAKQMEA